MAREQLPVARSLARSGYKTKEIAEALDVSAPTVRRWRREDGASWEGGEDAGASATDFRALMHQLGRLMARVLANKELEPLAKADALSKLHHVLAGMQDRWGALDLQLGVCEKLARWANSHLNEEKRMVAAEILAGFTDDLREESRA